ncbi:putative transcription regulator Others family [Medicago truncatula]|uniref:Paired amphipathic helix protein n=2 Tax=Medicago truncatula TaxID=3880 RepID=G7JZR3_MEDTR|nr:paired amphipathic helix protein [Medicago truncatula]RHN56648.1 putative transcription regulator Others family [Medicago truncatula]
MNIPRNYCHEHALEYLVKGVKLASRYDNSIKYDEFLKLIRDFKAGRIDIRGVQSRVRVLLQRHQGLLFGFKTFLIMPAGSYSFHGNSHDILIVVCPLPIYEEGSNYTDEILHCSI